MWMKDKRCYQLTYDDVAVRLDLIARVHGIQQAENYFNIIPTQLKYLEVYNALLNCFDRAELVEKAEALMQQMKDMGLARSILTYNILLHLYYKTGSYEKLENLLHEMEEKGIGHDGSTYATQISAYAANSDVEGIDEILTRMETDPEVVDWYAYSAAANRCIRAGLVDKALSMLKKSEELILTATRKSAAFEYILTQYATIGKKDEVLRLWELYNKHHKVYNQEYMCDNLAFEEEWESRKLSYDVRIPKFLISACCRKGCLEKAERLLHRVMEKGGKPDAKIWRCLASGYFKHNQTQKAIEATKQEISIAMSPSFWRPSKSHLAASLDYLKGRGDLEGPEEIIRLLRDKGFVSEDIQERLLDYIKDGESQSPLLLLRILNNSMDEDEENSHHSA